jgi:hypothetical protein
MMRMCMSLVMCVQICVYHVCMRMCVMLEHEHVHDGCANVQMCVRAYAHVDDVCLCMCVQICVYYACVCMCEFVWLYVHGHVHVWVFALLRIHANVDGGLHVCAEETFQRMCTYVFSSISWFWSNSKWGNRSRAFGGSCITFIVKASK